MTHHAPLLNRFHTPHTPLNSHPPPLTVMLVDDNDFVRYSLRLLLQQKPGVHVVAEAADVPDAIKAYNDTQPDVLVLDLQMPSGSGLEVLEHVRSHNRTCTIIILSGSLNPHIVKRCLDTGANHCFNKALEFSKISTILSQLSQARTPSNLN